MQAFDFSRWMRLLRWQVSAVTIGVALPAIAQAGNPAPLPLNPQASLLILPIRIAGQPMTRASEVVALLLEQKGLANVDLASVAFEPIGDPDSWNAALSDYLCAHPIEANFVLYAEFLGSPRTGLTELRAVLANRAGEILWTDRKTTTDAAFEKYHAREPMTMAVLLVDDVAPQFGLNAATAKAAQPGRFAQLMDQRSGLPPRAERDALVARQRAFALKRAKATIEVYPVRLGAVVDSAGAVSLARKLCAADIGERCGIAEPVAFPPSPPDPNEQKALWDLARAFRTYLRSHPSEADYALYADFMLRPGTWERGAVHFIVCESHGDWVIVDFQNSHHADYRIIRPETKDDCGDLVVLRLTSYLTAASSAPSSGMDLRRPNDSMAIATNPVRP